MAQPPVVLLVGLGTIVGYGQANLESAMLMSEISDLKMQNIAVNLIRILGARTPTAGPASSKLCPSAISALGANTVLQGSKHNDQPGLSCTTVFCAVNISQSNQYSSNRVPCKICERYFAPEALARHANICKRASVNLAKRKPFDSSKQRVIDGELSLKQIKQAQKKEIKPPKSHWREKHQDFINAVRNARGVQHAISSGGPLPPPPPPSINPDYIQCPYCSRRFNQQAGERHISFCKDSQSRLPRDNSNSNAAAKQNARLNYQAPKLKAKSSPVSPTVSSTPARGGARPAPTPTRSQVTPPSSSGRTPVGGRTAPSKTTAPGMASPSSRTPVGVAARGRGTPTAGRRY